MAHSKIRPESYKKSIPSARNCVSPLLFSVAPPRLSWNIGRSSADKTLSTINSQLKTLLNGQRKSSRYQITNSRRTSEPRPARGHRARSARREHHGVLQRV